jgi:hypothetical protein
MIQILMRPTTKPFYIKEDGQCMGRGLAADMLALRGFSELLNMFHAILLLPFYNFNK